MKFAILKKRSVIKVCFRGSRWSSSEWRRLKPQFHMWSAMLDVNDRVYPQIKNTDFFPSYLYIFFDDLDYFGVGGRLLEI